VFSKIVSGNLKKHPRIQQMNKEFRRAICFCNKPILKSYKCDWFQIIPIPDYIDAGVKPNHYPFILEYNFNKNDIVQISHEDFVDGNSEFFSELNHENNVMRYILRLLSIVTNHHFFVYDSTDQGWFINLNESDSKKIKCQYGIKLYHDEKFKGKMYISKFTESEFEEIQKVKHNRYYTHPDIDNQKENEVTIGEYTSRFFESLGKLDKTKKEYFDSAVVLINNGMKIRNHMKSMAFLAFISSIETMAYLESKSNDIELEFECKSCKRIKSSPFTCKTCEKPIWGISQQIKIYLKKYLSQNEGFNSIINKLYGRRSKIAHTGNLMMGDIFFDWNNPEKRNDHYMELIASMQYSKMSLVNYILYQ